MTTRHIKSIAVFCGSNHGASEEFAEGAKALGHALGSGGIKLIYGGTTKGLMGVVADAALSSGGEVHGIITARLHEKGHSHEGLTLCEVTQTLRERKQRMAELADAFIALPGGIGTMEEFMDVWTMNQGFFDSFLGFIDHMVVEKFLPAAHRHSTSVDANAEALIGKLQTYQRVDIPKWL